MRLGRDGRNDFKNYHSKQFKSCFFQGSANWGPVLILVKEPRSDSLLTKSRQDETVIELTLVRVIRA